MNDSLCQQVQHELPWFIGGELPAERERAAANHLRDCSACRRQAAALQQASKAIGEAGRVVPDGVDEAMFAAMHGSILLAVGREEAERLRGEMARQWSRRQWSRPQWSKPMWSKPMWRWVQALAAAAMFLFGWWLVDAQAVSPVFGRTPIGSPVGSDGAARAVPYAGHRVQLQSLGDEWKPAEGGVGNGVGPGMMGRWRLRTLEDFDFVVPVPPLPAASPRDGK